MRILLVNVLTFALGLHVMGSARAADQPDPKAIIDRAIKAAGAAKLTRLKAETWKEEGTYYGMGNGLPYTGNYAVQWPDRFRMEIEGVFTVVLNGDEGWVKTNEETKAMTKEQLANQKEELYTGRVASLVPLKGEGFTLKPLDEITVGKHPAVGVRVSRKGHGDVDLYFDKTTGLLAKSESKVHSQEEKGKQVNQEVFMSDYQEVEGVKLPMKIVMKRDGKQFVDAEIRDAKLVEKLDDKVFAKP